MPNSQLGRVDLTTFFKGLRLENDEDVIQSALTREVQAVLEGLIPAGALEKVAQADELIVFTHQIRRLQERTQLVLEQNHPLKDLPIAWLIGPDYEPLFAEALFQKAHVVHASEGGAFDFQLKNAKTVYLGGGALDQCLVRTVGSVAKHSTKRSVTIKIVQPLTYVDMIRQPSVDLASFVKNREQIGNFRSFQKRVRVNLRTMLREEGFQLARQKKNKTKAPVGIFAPPLIFENAKSGRTLTIEYFGKKSP